MTASSEEKEEEEEERRADRMIREGRSHHGLPGSEEVTVVVLEAKRGWWERPPRWRSMREGESDTFRKRGWLSCLFALSMG